MKTNVRQMTIEAQNCSDLSNSGSFINKVYSVVASIIRALIGGSCEACVLEANSGDELVDGLQMGLEGPRVRQNLSH